MTASDPRSPLAAPAHAGPSEGQHRSRSAERAPRSASRRTARLAGAALLGGLTLTAACSGGGGSSGGGGGLSLLSCTLGCTVGSSNQASCGVTDVFLNQEIRITFSRPIDVTTVDNNTFQVVNVATGQVPPSSFTVDAVDNRVLVYRPQLTFDSTGNPVFGLEEDATYTFRIPGQSLDPIGPYIESSSGQANQTRLFCTLQASRGIFDANPGAPTVEVFVDRVASFDSNGDPDVIDFDQPASGATDVWRSSDILMTFNDVMNPATLVNPISGESNTIRVRLDPDGIVSDPSDQVDLPGVFSIAIDQDAQTTTVTFQPEGGFPSAGTDLTSQRRIVLELPDTIRDLGGNSISNSGSLVFTPEAVAFDPVELAEEFEDNSQEDSASTGSLWAVDGVLLSGETITGGLRGGGSGRLGDLTIPSGVTITLNTDVEDFTAPEFADLSIYDPLTIVDPAVVGQPLTVTGGVFEFATLQIESGGTLRMSGSNPGRLLVRGEALLEGVLDIAGRDGADQDSVDFLGGAGGAPGAGGGIGGDGGDRPDGENFTDVGGVNNPNDPLVYDEVNGQSGGGIAFPNLIAPTTFVASGVGGLAWPQPTAVDPTLEFPDDPEDVAGMQFESRQRCAVIGPGGVGEGGAYALPGTAGDYQERLNGLNQVDPFTPPPSFGGGDVDALMLDATVRTLDPNLGFLRGGSGGGGGGAHFQETTNNGQILNDCSVPASGTLTITDLAVHSGAGGGGAGGAIQVQAGRRVVHNGVISAFGGDGGSVLLGGSTDFAQAGGGGSGGAILFQAPSITIQNTPSRFNVRGGAGGLGANGSLGGDGSPGLIRLESISPVLDLLVEAGKITPTISDLDTIYGVGPEAILSTGEWSPSGLGLEGLSGAQSCWIRPDGNFYSLLFDGDDPITGLPGWDLELVIDGFDDPQSYRGENDLFNDTIENVFGNELGSAPLVVRFQGARVPSALSTPCDVVLNGSGSQLVPGSLTGWVDHPVELNTFFNGDESQASNIVRFVVIWDLTQAEAMGLRGIEGLRLAAQPD